MPTYADLMTETGEDGHERSYLSTEESYRFIRDMQRRNLIVPIVGDFQGPKAIRAVGKYLKAQGAAVTVFYVSNVEAYLFRPSPPNAHIGAMDFYDNVRELPLTESSAFVRSIPVPSKWGGATGWQSLVTASIQKTIKDVDSGRVRRYSDLFAPSFDEARLSVPVPKNVSTLSPPPVDLRAVKALQSRVAFRQIAGKSSLDSRMSAFLASFMTIALAILSALTIHRVLRDALAVANHTRLLITALVAVLGVECFLLAPYWDEFLHGRTVDAEVSQLTNYEASGRGELAPRWMVWAVADNPNRSRLRAEIDSTIWSDLRVGDRVPFLVVPERPGRYEIGTTPRLNLRTVLPGVSAVIAFAGILIWARVAKRRPLQ